MGIVVKNPPDPSEWEATNSGNWRLPKDYPYQRKIDYDALRSKLLVGIVTAIVGVIVTGLVMKSCGSCLNVGSWEPPYTTKAEAFALKTEIDEKFKTNKEAHKKIRAEVRQSRDSIICYITTPAKQRTRCVPKDTSDTNEEE